MKSRDFLITLTRSPIGLIGTILAGTSGFMIVTLVLMEMVGEQQHPYLGVITFMILPMIFILGLVLIFLGIWRQKKKAKRLAESGESVSAEYPVVDLNDDRTRAWLVSAGAFGVMAALVLVLATSKGIEYVDSNKFCGATCHVMQPEFTAYQESPHSRVKCVECHIGSGAQPFIEAKLSGMRQVVRLFTDSYERPIPTPVHNLRPAPATCEHCHTPTRFIGDRTQVNNKFESDSANTHLQSILQVHVGGATLGKSQGIHWHVDPAVQITYRSDPSREDIREVVLTRPDGTETRWLNSAEPNPRWTANVGADGEASDYGEGPPPTDMWRTMDCVDCHNRPTHQYWSPEKLMDQALLRGAISADLPFVKREGLRLLQEDWGSNEEALAGISEGIEAFYSENYPNLAQAEAVRDAGEVIGLLWGTAVFPEMNVTWGTYPEHIGHPEGSESGCLRCHTSTMQTEDGTPVTTTCTDCHEMLAVDRPAAGIKLVLPDAD